MSLSKYESVAYCPDCGAKTGVTDIRHGANGLRRRRHCDQCNYSFTTYEITKERMRKFQRAVKDLETVKGVLK